MELARSSRKLALTPRGLVELEMTGSRLARPKLTSRSVRNLIAREPNCRSERSIELTLGGFGQLFEAGESDFNAGLVDDVVHRVRSGVEEISAHDLDVRRLECAASVLPHRALPL